MHLRRVLFAGLLILTLALSGCSGDSLAAEVNGEKITAKDLNDRINAIKKVYESMGMSFETAEQEQALEELKSGLLEIMIDKKVVAQEVKRLNLDINADKVKAEEAEFKQGFTTDLEYENIILAQLGMTAEEVRTEMALYLHLTEGMTVSDADVEKFFEEYRDFYDEPEQVKARHILVQTEEEAKAIINELNAGKDFAELAKEKSIEPAAATTGGDLGYFTREEMVSEFSDAAFSQEVGKISQTPVKTKFGYHVILVEDHKPAVKADLAKIKDQVAKDALENAKQEKYRNYFNELRQKAEVKYGSGFEPAQ